MCFLLMHLFALILKVVIGNALINPEIGALELKPICYYQECSCAVL